MAAFITLALFSLLLLSEAYHGAKQKHIKIDLSWNQVARQCEVDTMYCEAINAAAPTPYLSSIPPSIHASTYSTHLCSKKNSSVYIEIEMKEATPSTPQQIIIISHPNHLPNTFQSTPTSHPRVEMPWIQRCHSPPLSSTSRITMKGKRDYETRKGNVANKKQEAQNTKQEVEVKQCRARPSFSPNLILFEICSKIRRFSNAAMLCEREIGSDHVCMYARAREEFDGLHRRPQNETPDMNPDPIPSKRPD